MTTRLTEKQALAIYNFWISMNHNNTYITSLIGMGENIEAECLIRGIDKLSTIAKIEDYSPIHFTWLKKVKEANNEI
jgi:hypothetical protein